MRACCAPGGHVPGGDGYRRVLWTVLAINLAGFAVEAVAGVLGNSVSLQADALDFLGDAGNYGIALFVLARSVRWRASAALVKGWVMGLFGFWVLASAAYRTLVLGLPSAAIMGTAGAFALTANLASTALLFRYRVGDSNMRSVWLCSRNDALGNIAVLLAAGAVAWTGTRWPDLAVAAVIAGLAVTASLQVIRQARGELRADRAVPVAAE